MDDIIAADQIWQRNPSGYLYRVIEAGDGSFGQDIVLRNLHSSRSSRISPSGLRSKFTRRADLEKADAPAR